MLPLVFFRNDILSILDGFQCLQKGKFTLDNQEIISF